jgi:transcriptional regulator with XRE-family HTH domain
LAEPGALGRNLKRLRAARGWSQPELAKRSGVSLGFVRSLEQGHRRESTVGYAQALARALGVTVDDLLREDAAPTVEEGRG